MTAHAASYTHSAAASSRAITSMVLGILGIVICPLFARFAWYLGHHELDDIRGFRAAHQGEGFARTGQILGIIGSLPLLLIAAIVVLAIPMLLFAVLAA